MLSLVEGLVYFYLFICIGLLAFNILYITRAKRMSRRREKRIKEWRHILVLADPGKPLPDSLIRRLRRIDNLTAFFNVASEHFTGERADARSFVMGNQPFFRTLADVYGRKQAMERAFFAYVVATFYSLAGMTDHSMSELLLSYLPDSTVYCRENILNALYVLGSESAVEHAFDTLNDNRWYHHPKLLSDGMVRFAGDQEALVRRLWAHRGEWEECLLLGVVQFAALLPENAFSEEFLQALEHETLPLEVRFALLRYFQKHIYPPAKPVMLHFLAGQGAEDSQLAVVAASELAAYPGEDTHRALTRAMHDRNWYIRRNAASSLNRLGMTEAEKEEIRHSGDRYAVEMMEYVLGSEGVRKPAAPAAEKKETAEVGA